MSELASLLHAEVEEQRAANQSALPYRDLYAVHREHLSRRILAEAGSDANRSVCVLGAGNCYDVELAELATRFREVHLVDLDARALERARAELSAELAQRVTLHAPIDLTGMLRVLERWSRRVVTAEELIQHPAKAAQEMLARVGGPFDVVVSACVLTQMQLVLLRALGDEHQLFAAIRHTLSVTHFRTLAVLAAPGGRVVFASDLRTTSASEARHEAPRALFERVVLSGDAFYVAHPRLLEAMIDDDPVLEQALAPESTTDVWFWQQGPERMFLVYALALDRRAPLTTFQRIGGKG